MKSYATLLIKQLTIAAIFLSCVTVVSLGIRQLRFSLHWANTNENPVVADAEPTPDQADSPNVEVEPEPKYTDIPDRDPDSGGFSADRGGALYRSPVARSRAVLKAWGLRARGRSGPATVLLRAAAARDHHSEHGDPNRRFLSGHRPGMP